MTDMGRVRQSVRADLPYGLSHLLAHPDLLFQAVAYCHFDSFGVVMGLDAGPEIHRGAKVARQAQSGVGADAALLVADFADTHGRHADVLGLAVLAESKGFHELFEQDFTGMGGGKVSHGDKPFSG